MNIWISITRNGDITASWAEPSPERQRALLAVIRVEYDEDSANRPTLYDEAGGEEIGVV